MNKKGVEERLWFWTFYLVLVIIVAAIFFRYINEEAGSEAFIKRYLARDIALLANTLYASPGNISVLYPFKERFYNVKIGEIEDKYRVRVSTVTEVIEGGFPADYFYAEDLLYDTRLKGSLGERYGIAWILFTKKDNEAFVEEFEPVAVKLADWESEIVEEKKGEFILPIEGEMVVTSCFGERVLEGKKDIHKGIDIRTCDFDKNRKCVNYNKEIRAVADGKVTAVLFGPEYYNTIKIEHRDYIETRYLHLQSTKVEKDDEVKKGEVIGIAGKHRAKDAHLHFAVLMNGRFVDPLPFFDMGKVKFTTNSNCYYNKDKYAYKEIIKENVIA